jgi:hypothetical protein
MTPSLRLRFLILKDRVVPFAETLLIVGETIEAL